MPVRSCRLVQGTEEACRAHEDAFLPAPIKTDDLGFVLPVSEWRERISWAVPRSSAMSESAMRTGQEGITVEVSAFLSPLVSSMEHQEIESELSAEEHLSVGRFLRKSPGVFIAQCLQG